MSTSTDLTPAPAEDLRAPLQGDRLATIRRLYFYLVALVSFIAALAGLDGLLQQLTNAWLGESTLGTLYDSAYTRQVIAQSGGVLLVATPIFLLHWGYMQRRLDEPGERGAALRKFFLYVASAVAIGYVLVRSYSILNGLARLAFGEPLAASDLWPSAWLHWLLVIVAAGALQLYLHRVLVDDGDYGREMGLAGSWRRLYQALAGLLALGLLIQGSADILSALWRALSDLTAGHLITIGGLWRYQLSDGIALTLLGAVLARINWRRWLTITVLSPAEATSVLRRFYLYLAVVVSALATLIPVANLLYEVLLVLLGSPFASWAGLADRLIDSLPYAPAGLVSWVWHWRVLRQEATLFGESHEGATVRRLYYYAVAATGLTLLWFGAVNILQTGLDWLLVVGPREGRFWAEPLATGLSLLAVGVPVWSIHWRAAQTQARRSDAQGMEERASLPRRIYLYGVALVGALLILFYLAQVVYRLLLLLLGDPDAGLLSTATVADVARSVIAALLWVVHVLAIRDDTRQGTDEPASVRPAVESRAELVQRIEQLERELAAAHAALAKLPAE
jgi:hypothetical protein